MFGVYLYGFIYYVWLQMVLKGDILYKGFLLLFLASFYLAENLGVTFWYQSRGLSELSTSRCSQSQAEAKFSAKRFLTLILVFKIYFWKVSIFGKLVFWESFYFGKVGVSEKLEGYYFWKLTMSRKCLRRHVYQSIEPPRGVSVLVYYLV